MRESGAGDPVVLLHGFPQTGECWRAVSEPLAASHRVIVPDLPGFGRSSAPPSYEASSVAETLTSFLDTVAARPATVVGHDWGGSLAFALALARPDHIARLVVTNAPFRSLDLKRAPHFLLFNIPLVPEIAFRIAGDRLVPFLLRAGSARKDVFTEAAVRPYVEAYGDSERVRSALAYYRTMTRRVIARRFSRRPAAPSRRTIACPTLLVWGMRDPALPAALLDGILRDIPQARAVRLDDVGHFVPEEAPAELAREIAAFMANG